MAERRKLQEVYTVEDLRDGSWATWQTGMGKEGTYVLSLLCARENGEQESYKEACRVSFLSDDSAELVIFQNVVPHRIKATSFLPHVLMAYGVKVRGYEMGAGSLPDEFTLLPATRCTRCMRILTRPESIRTGVGDECAGRRPRAGSKFERARSLGTAEEMNRHIRARNKEREAENKFRLPIR